MESRELGRCGLRVSAIGYGAFKIGRNEGIKYPAGYALPSEADAARLLNAVLDAGVSYIDTAPAYGLSEERIGRALGHRRREFVLSTKVGEAFERGSSRHDFSAPAIQASLERSLRRLGRDVLDIVFLHAPADDAWVLTQTDAVETLQRARQRGWLRCIGWSGKTLAAERAALAWADVLMVEYNATQREHEPILAEAAAAGVGVVVKKPLASGTLEARQALHFVLGSRAVGSALISTLSFDHLRENLQAAGAACG